MQVHQLKTDKEKKDFLTNDLIERMIRVEQRVSAHFSKPCKAHETEFYRSLSPEKKKNFVKYLECKKKKKYFFISLLAIPILMLILVNLSFAGAVIGRLPVKTSLLNIVFILILVIGIGIAIFLLNEKGKKERKYSGHVGVIDNVLLKKYGGKVFKP
jgi:hypothetical protein